MSAPDKSPRAINLGHGITSISAPSLEDAARLCAYFAGQIRFRQERNVGLGNAPDPTQLMDAYTLEMAGKVLADVAEHKDAVRAAIADGKKRQRDEEWAANERRERGRRWAEKKRKEAANG